MVHIISPDRPDRPSRPARLNHPAYGLELASRSTPELLDALSRIDDERVALDGRAGVLRAELARRRRRGDDALVNATDPHTEVDPAELEEGADCDAPTSDAGVVIPIRRRVR